MNKKNKKKPTINIVSLETLKILNSELKLLFFSKTIIIKSNDFWFLCCMELPLIKSIKTCLLM